MFPKVTNPNFGFFCDVKKFALALENIKNTKENPKDTKPYLRLFSSKTMTSIKKILNIAHS